MGLLIDTKKSVSIIGDKSLSNRDFSRVTDPLKLFGANIKSKNNLLPVKILGSNFLRPIKYYEKLGSAQCKTAVMLAALKSPGKTIIFAKKSRNHSEILFRNLKIPTKIKRFKKNDYIEILGQKNFKEIQSEKNTYFTGAYLGYGFHEDGIKSSQAICKLINSRDK